MKQIKNAGKKLALLGIGLVLGVALAEVAVWVREAGEARRVPRKRYLETISDGGGIRLAVLGGSTSNGSPYSDVTRGRFNLLTVLEYLLERRYGCPTVEIDNYAGPNWAMETTINHYFERPGHKPDLLVLYSGQNETTRYYTPNMVPPPRVLSPLASLGCGSLLLRRMFTRQVAPGDRRYEGEFFSSNVIPPYERAHNLARYKRHVERLIRHADDEGILLVIVIPQSNYLFPPTRSVYEGPPERKAEALDLFKRAIGLRHLENDADGALALFEKLAGFCAFADLSYELGELYYSRGEVERALPHLRQARATDGFPICITPAYRDVLHELVEEHGVAHIDMDAAIAGLSGRSVPDYGCFLDDCHVYREVYLAIARELLRVLREKGVTGTSSPPGEFNPDPEEWGRLGITPDVWREALTWEASYHVKQAGYMFLKPRMLATAKRYLRLAADMGDKDAARRMAGMEGRLRDENERLRRWIAHEGPLPLGKAPATPRTGTSFRDEFGLELSQGNALFTHGEPELALEHYRAAIELDPGSATVRVNMGTALHRLRRYEEAVAQYEQALALDARSVMAHRNLGNTLQSLGRFEDAIAHYREALGIAPGDGATQQVYYPALNRLAWRLATSADPGARNGRRAVELADELCRATGYRAPEALDTLAAACAEAGRFADAVAAGTKALELARESGNAEAADTVAKRVETYRAGRAWREKLKR